MTRKLTNAERISALENNITNLTNDVQALSRSVALLVNALNPTVEETPTTKKSPSKKSTAAKAPAKDKPKTKKAASAKVADKPTTRTEAIAAWKAEKGITADKQMAYNEMYNANFTADWAKWTASKQYKAVSGDARKAANKAHAKKLRNKYREAVGLPLEK